MEIKNLNHANKLLIEQYNKVNAQINKASNEADISKLLETKESLLANMKDVEIHLLMKPEVSLYDKNGDIINPKLDPEMIENLPEALVAKLKEETIQSNPLINQNQQPTRFNEDRSARAEYFSAVSNLVRNVFPYAGQDLPEKNMKKDGFRVLGLFGIILLVIVVFYFLIIN